MRLAVFRSAAAPSLGEAVVVTGFPLQGFAFRRTSTLQAEP
jgi:hypothetical protein